MTGVKRGLDVAGALLTGAVVFPVAWLALALLVAAEALVRVLTRLRGAS